MQVLLDNNRQKEWEADVTAVWMSNFYEQKSQKKNRMQLTQRTQSKSCSITTFPRNAAMCSAVRQSDWLNCALTGSLLAELQ